MNFVAVKNAKLADEGGSMDVPNFDEAENVLMKTSGGWQRLDRTGKRRRELNETLRDDKET